MKTETAKCPECGAAALYETMTYAAGNYGIDLLPGLGKKVFLGLLPTERAVFRVVVCAECGLTRFFTDPVALTMLPSSKQWQRI